MSVSIIDPPEPEPYDKFAFLLDVDSPEFPPLDLLPLPPMEPAVSTTSTIRQQIAAVESDTLVVHANASVGVRRLIEGIQGARRDGRAYTLALTINPVSGLEDGLVLTIAAERRFSLDTYRAAQSGDYDAIDADEAHTLAELRGAA